MPGTGDEGDLAGLCGVVCDEKDLLAGRTELLEDGGDAVDERVALPDDAVAIEDEDVDRVDEPGWGATGVIRGGGALMQGMPLFHFDSSSPRRGESGPCICACV